MSEKASDAKKVWDLSSLEVLARFVQDMSIELWRGARDSSLPWPIGAGISVVFTIIFTGRWDAHVWRMLHGARFYPFHPIFYWPYVSLFVTSGFWIWAISRVVSRRELIDRLSRAFRQSGLETRTGRFPGFVTDLEMDNDMRKLIVTSVGIPESEFTKAKSSLEAELQVFIDQIRSRVERGTVELHYAHKPLEDYYEYDPSLKLPPLTYLVGKTRSQPLLVSLREIPHALAGGYTTSGKSGFMRQLLTSLILNNRGAEFTLIDLKAGTELGTFEGIPNVRVYMTTGAALEALRYVESQLEKRMALLKANHCSDMDAFYRLPVEKRVYTKEWPKEKPFSRHITAIDEAAELFLASSSFGSKEAQIAKRIAAKIAALGRAVGIHLVVATQRPDRNAVDPLIKSNLQGRLCFQMADNASSMTILDSVRAADLPPTKGRAIWRSGLSLVEVQVPWLSHEMMEKLLTPLKTKASTNDLEPTRTVEPSQSKPDVIETLELAEAEMTSHEEGRKS